MQEIKDKLVEIVREQFGDDAAVKGAAGESLFSSHSDRDAEPELDSLDRVEFLMAVEDAYDIEIPDSIQGGFSTVDEVARYVATITAEAAHAGH